MAKHKYPYQALSKLLNAKTELATADFNGLADMTSSATEINVLDGIATTLTAAELSILDGVTASTAELNYLDTSAVGTVTASKAMTVDASYQVSGWRRKSIDMDGGGVSAAMAGSIISNEASGSAATFNLPAALVGMEFYFYVLAAQELRINPDGTETIGLPSSGAQQAAGKYITADAVGEYVHIICAKAGQWETLDYRGTWGVEG